MPNSPPHHGSLDQISGDNNHLSWSFVSPSDENSKTYYEAQWGTAISSGEVTNATVTQSLTDGSTGFRQGGTYGLSGSQHTYQGIIPPSWYSGAALSAGETYYINFRRNDKQGPTAWTSATNVYATTDGGVSVPDAPGATTVTGKTSSTLGLSWSAVSGATGYKLFYGTSNNPTGPGTTQSGTTKAFGSLPAATTYYFRLKATNSAGDSGYSPTLTVDTTTVTPSIPVASSNVDPTEQVITWPTPTGTFYSYLYGTGNNSTNQLQAIAVSSVETHTQATTPGSTYYYRTRTVTTNHNDFYSAYGPQLTAVAASVAEPTSISYVATSTSQFMLVWSNPTYSDRTYHHVGTGTPYSIDTPSYETGQIRVIGDGDTVMGTPISLGQNDGFAIKFRNYYDGHYSAYTSAFTGYTLPGPPTSFAAADLSDTEIQLSWVEPTKAADGLTQGYVIKYRIDNTGSWITVTTSASGTSYVHSSLTQGTAYYYEIWTTTTAGISTIVYANDTTQTGPDPVAGDALGLGQLGYSTGVNGNATSETSMQACNGGATTEASFKDFYCGAVGSLSGTQYVSDGNSRTFTANFNNRGTLFNSRIGIEDGNFTWTSDNTGIATVETNADRTCSITGQNPGWTTIRMAFAGRYNSHSSIPSPPASSKYRTITVIP